MSTLGSRKELKEALRNLNVICGYSLFKQCFMKIKVHLIYQ